MSIKPQKFGFGGGAIPLLVSCCDDPWLVGVTAVEEEAGVAVLLVAILELVVEVDVFDAAAVLASGGTTILRLINYIFLEILIESPSS
jgi:hypothetical protein